jgi:ADP-ribose pyrophosphatase
MKPKLSPPKRVHRNPFMDIVHRAADFGEFQKEYWIVEFGPRAGIVAIRGNDVLLVRQYRLLPDALVWEIPGGRVDGAEDPTEAAMRECAEEAGVACRNLQPILVYYPGLDNVQNRTSLFFSHEVEEIPDFQPQPDEAVERHWVPLTDAISMVFDGRIQDAMSVAGLLGFQALNAETRMTR